MSDALCPCGNPTKKKSAKYCSNPCKYKYRVRPTGLKYNITKPNAGWFPPGVDSYNEYKPHGKTPPNFKGEDASYSSYHKWVTYHKGKAETCSRCGSTDTIHWANVSNEYKRELDDWMELCVPCHKQHDSGADAIKRKFG